MPDTDLWCVLQGQGQVMLEGRGFPVQAGTCFLFPPGSAPRARHNPARRLVVLAVHFDWIEEGGQPLCRIPGLPSGEPIQVADTRRLRQLAELLAEGAPPDHPAAQLQAQLGLWQLLLLLNDPESSSQPRPDSRIQKVLREVAEALARNWTVGAMARVAGLSPSQFSRLFRKTTGQSPRRYIIAARMARACTLLRESDLGQAEIAEMLGFTDVYFFNRQFTRQHGTSPGRFRKGGG